MARCLQCGADTPAHARYCPACGAASPRPDPSPEQPPLPFSPWGPPLMQAQPAGAGSRAMPVVGPPLTARQVAIAVATALGLLLLVIFYAGNGVRPAPDDPTTPRAGTVGEVVRVGHTGWSVAFVGHPATINGQPPARGQYHTIGVIIANDGVAPIELSRDTLRVRDAETGTVYDPMLIAYGTPEELQAGQYTTRYALGPHASIVGVALYDTPTQATNLGLMIRDLTTDTAPAHGTIDLTRTVKE